MTPEQTETEQEKAEDPQSTPSWAGEIEKAADDDEGGFVGIIKDDDESRILSAIESGEDVDQVVADIAAGRNRSADSEESDAKADDTEVEGFEEDTETIGESEEFDLTEDPDYETALSALRKQLSSSVIDKMTKEEIMENGARLNKIQGDIKEKLDERSQQIREDTEDSESPREPVGAEPPRQTISATLAESLAPHMEAVKEALGEEVSGPIQKALEASAQSSEQNLNGVRGLTNHLMWEMSRIGLSESIPALKSNAAWVKIRDKAATLYKTGDYGGLDGISGAVQDAARILTKAMPSDPKKEAIRQKRRGGRSTIPSSKIPRVTKGAKDMSQDEYEDRILDLLESGREDDAMMLTNHRMG